MRIRVVVYNVRGFRDDVGGLVRLVEHFRPDVLLLNESGSRWRLRRFSKAVAMHAAVDPRSPLRRRVKNAVLVRPPWRIVEHRLHRFEGSARWYPRGALLARLETDGAALWAIAIHLGLHPLERRRHAEELRSLTAGLDAPAVIGGDLNERPDGRAVGVLVQGFRDAWLLAGDVDGETYPASEPEARIDYLFVSPQVSALKVIVPPGPDARQASDHLPVVAELTIPDASAET
ncbi:MAG: endonuclease/exonuclease/phosphatase family protein [Actinobacteria bacterium]|nr:endonuclease/exonuclease/phosphatase family protein [Actinomycetota bacterium]